MTCSSLIICCMDFRLVEPIREFLARRRLLGDYDIVAVAGASKSLASPQEDGEQAFLLKQIHLARRLHGIRQVMFINHTDCGAYGGGDAFVDDDEEYRQHIGDMRRAKALVLRDYPYLSVSLVLARVQEMEVVFAEIR